jgi:DNA polymerase-3 subunit alpha
MATVTLEDTKGIIEAVVFPDLYSKHLLVIRSDKPLVVTGSIEKTEDGATRIRAKNIAPLQETQDEMAKVVRIKIDCAVFRKDSLRKLRDILASIKGDSQVSLEFLQNGDRRVFPLPEVRIDAGKTATIGKCFLAGLDIEVMSG